MNIKNKSWFLTCVVGLFIWSLPTIVVADVIYTSLPANITLTNSVSFVTQIQIASTNNSLGAFSILIQHDPNAVKLLGVSVSPNSGFANNLFVDLSSLNTGKTRAVGFQTATTNSQSATTVLSMTWQTVGATVISTTITNVVETSVDALWQGNQTWAGSTVGTLSKAISGGNALTGITGISLSGTSLVFSGTNGVSGSTNFLLMSTNLATPLNQWTPVATSILGLSGNFTITLTNAVNRNIGQQFYILQNK
jgi:hypothetical protein